MSLDPLVSVLLPTYKRAHYLSEAISSALSQTYPNFELIVLDDASPDNTPEVVRSFADDGRMRYVRHEQNLGLPGNWRSGLTVASGEYVCILEDDDRLHPAFIERLVEPLRADPDTLFSFCDHWVIRADGARDVGATDEFTRDFGRAALSEGALIHPAEDVLLRQCVSLTAAMFRRRNLPPTLIDDSARGAMDLWIAYHCLRSSPSGNVHFIADRLMEYRVHDEGMSRQTPAYITEGMAYVYAAIIRDDHFISCRNKLCRKLHIYQTDLGYRYLSDGDFAKSRTIFAQSRQNARSFRSVIGSILAYSGALGKSVVNITRHRPR